jgi:hypothetical protein
LKIGDVEKQKVFVDQEGAVVITCPACSKQKSARVDPAKLRDKDVRGSCLVRCICQKRFAVKLEFRRDSRKQSDLNGEYLCMPKGKPRGKLKIVNISQNGIGAQISETHKFEVGDELLIWFTLDDNIDSLIEKNVTIRCLKDDYIGVEFLGSSPPGKTFGDFLASGPDDEDVKEVDIEDFGWTGSFYR